MRLSFPWDRADMARSAAIDLAQQGFEDITVGLEPPLGATFQQWVVRADRPPPALQSRVDAAVVIAGDYIGCDGGHHKQHALVEILKTLLGDGYDEWVTAWRAGEDGPETYDFDEGVP